MPIYAYKCDACGYAKDVLQKMSDARLTVCPSCGAEAFTKQVTAAGFQLKGSGWYVTDFRGGNAGAPAEPKGGEGAAAAASAAPTEAGPAPAPGAPAAPSAPAVATPAPAPPPTAAPAPAAKP